MNLSRGMQDVECLDVPPPCRHVVAAVVAPSDTEATVVDDDGSITISSDFDSGPLAAATISGSVVTLRPRTYPFNSQTTAWWNHERGGAPPGTQGPAPPRDGWAPQTPTPSYPCGPARRPRPTHTRGWRVPYARIQSR